MLRGCFVLLGERTVLDGEEVSIGLEYNYGIEKVSIISFDCDDSENAKLHIEYHVHGDRFVLIAIDNYEDLGNSQFTYNISSFPELVKIIPGRLKTAMGKAASNDETMLFILKTAKNKEKDEKII